MNSFGITTYIYTINWEEGQPPVETCELQARIKRNQIFKEACEQHNISMLFTAHQAMDNVNLIFFLKITIFLRLRHLFTGLHLEVEQLD